MQIVKKSVLALSAAGLLAMGATAHAEDTIKVGMIASLSGPFSQLGLPMEAGVKAWLKQNGDHVAGKKIELIIKDDGGPNPETEKRLAQELITRDHVNFLIGFSLTPNAAAVTSVATQAKVPMIIMNAATSSTVSARTPYTTRVSLIQPQIATPLGQWAAKNRIKKVYSLVSDYGPGLDAAKFFGKSFSQAGGQIVGEAHVPLKGPEFSAYLQRIKDAKPDAVFLFLPAGEQGVAFMKGFHEKQLDKAGIKVIATGDLTDDQVLDQMGDPALGMITAFHYSADHNSAQNKAFLKAYNAANPGAPRANFIAAAAYDGMHMIYNVVNALHGKVDSAQAMRVIKGMKIDSPRGPISIDPATNDIVQNVYIRRVEKKNGHLYNVEFATYNNVKDPAK